MQFGRLFALGRALAPVPTVVGATGMPRREA